MDEYIVPCAFLFVVAFVIGLCIGASCEATTELDNGCIVYNNNVYCVEEVAK